LPDDLDADHEAHKRYEKNIRTTKADLLAYERQKEAAMGLAPGTLVPVNATNESLIASGSSSRKGLTASEDLYRGADTLSYGDSKPSEDAIDRVVGKINKEYDGPVSPSCDALTSQYWQNKEEEEGRLG
jgi:pre-mRNA-splicing factor SYF2